MTSPVFGVTGWKNSGKTTLVTRLIAEFARRRLKVASVKHAHHGFDIDKPGSDSFRHREAGAREVMVVSGRRWALMHEMHGEAEPPLVEALARLSPCDLIVVEGYKRERHAKIECRRRATLNQAPLAPEDPSIVAIAADYQADGGGLPVFALDDVPAIADFIAGHLRLDKANG